MPACAVSAHWTRQSGSTRRRIRPSLTLRLCIDHLLANGYKLDMLERLRHLCRRRPRINFAAGPVADAAAYCTVPSRFFRAS
jgi:hypothetical protein